MTALVSPRLAAYSLIGGSWPSGDIPIRIQLDATATQTTSFPLADNSASWNAVALSALNDWNAVLGRSRLVGTTSSSTASAEGDGITTVAFASTIYGDAFDTFTLAVTITDNYDDDKTPTVKIHEADLIVNTGLTWNSYRGTLQSDPVDLRRVILHEFGHVLGLGHPDEASPPQNVITIMHSTVSNTENLQADDVAGVRFLYNTPLVTPKVTLQPMSQTVNVGDPVALAFAVNGQSTPPPANELLSYSWFFKATGAESFEKLFTLNTPNLAFGSTQLPDAGSYYLEIMTPDTTVDSNTVTLTVNPIATNATTALRNLSTRGTAGAGAHSMIAGFVVKGTSSKTVLIRAIGPTLATFGVTGTLADPQLTLRDNNSTTVATSLAAWDSGPNADNIRTTSGRVGAFALPAGSRDAVILTTITPGSYTAQATSRSGATGNALIEVYDADVSPDASSRLANLSTRGYVGTGSNILIAGFSVQGPGAHTYLIRVAGASLTQYGVTDPLFDPYLRLFHDSTQLRETDDWDSPAATQPVLKTAFGQVGAFTFTDRKESAMLVTLPPGNYTAQASGNDNNGSSSAIGSGLIEIYEMP
jgi:hypothetical protein